MKNLGKYNPLSICLLGLGLITLFISCVRDEDMPLRQATFPSIGDVFIDGFSAGLAFDAFGDSEVTAFDTDTKTTYNNSSLSMRFDIPNPSDGYAGGVFSVSGGRDLSPFNALTFYAKATKGETINEIGFGLSFGSTSEYRVARIKVPLTTAWKKYYIPIPNSAKLTAEKGMLWFAEAADSEAYSFWLDDVKFEMVGTIGQGRARIQNGDDVLVGAFEGQTIQVSGTSVTFNMPDGLDLTINAPATYFDFVSSSPEVVSIDGGTITVKGSGDAVVTAAAGSIEASGSLNVRSISEPTVPTRDQRIVTSIFSDAYPNVPVDFFNGFFFGDGQTTLGGAVEIAPNKNIINYTDLNFVIAEFRNPTVDVSNRTHVHFDLFTFDPVEGASLNIGLADFGANKVFGGGDDSRGDFFLTGAGLRSGEWMSLDLRLNEFVGLRNRDNLAQLIFASNQLKNLIVDNIYFYSVSDAQDASLASITVNGLPINGFASGVTNYQVPLPNANSEVPVIMATPNNTNARISIIAATSIPGTTIIEVTAPNGVTVQTYAIDFIVRETLSLPLTFESDEISYPFEDFGGGVLSRVDNPDKSGINTSNMVARMVKFSGEPFAGSSLELPSPIDFSQDRTFRMKVWVPKANVTVLLKVENKNNPSLSFEAEAITTLANAWEELTFNFNGINTNNSYDKFVWIFENGTIGDGSSNFTYYFDDIELFTDLNTDATLTEIQIAGVSLSGFDPSMFDYNVELAEGTTAVPSVSASARSADATVDITSAAALPGTTSIKVTAPDGVTTATYNINFTVFSRNSDATLSDLKVDDSTISGFSSSIFSYSVELPENTTTVPAVTVVVSSNGASAEVNPATSLPGTTTVVVTAEDGVTQNTYIVNFTVASGQVELVLNGGFENGTQPWFTNFGTGVPEIQSNEGNSFFFANVEVPGQPFDVNLSQVLSIVQGATYTLTFEAATGEGSTRTMLVGIGLNEAPFTASTATVTLTSELQTFSLTLSAAEFGGANSRVLFDMGGDSGVVVIDNVSLLRN